METEKESTICGSIGMCDSLLDRCVDGGKGFVAQHTMDVGDENANCHGFAFLGVAYKKSAKDNGLMLNLCPFCGGMPGYFKRDPALIARIAEAAYIQGGIDAHPEGSGV